MRSLRKAGKVPAVVYGHCGTTPLTIVESEFRDLLKKKGHSASLVSISIDGDRTLLSDIADIQRDPVTDRLLHVDFHEVSQAEKMTTVVPLEFFGEPIGVKNSGGILDIARHEVIVRCLPANLPSSIRVDVSALDIGDIIHLADVAAPQDVELVGDHATPIVSCNEVESADVTDAGAATGDGKAEEAKEQSTKAESAKTA